MTDGNGSTYSDLTDLVHTAEAVPEGVETADFSAFILLQPGEYMSPSRVIKGKSNPDGSITFEITFDSGFLRDGVFVGGKGDRTWVSTRLFQSKDAQGNPRPGKTSTVAEYLKKAGFEVKGLSGSELIDLMIQSQDIPVGVYVKWTERTERQADGTYPKETLKTRDFNVGTKDEPVYVPEVEVAGKKFQARHRVSGFTNITQ